MPHSLPPNPATFPTAGLNPTAYPHPSYFTQGMLPAYPGFAGFGLASLRNDQACDARIETSPRFLKLRKREQQELYEITQSMATHPGIAVDQLIDQFIHTEKSRKAQKCAMDVIVHELITNNHITQENKADLLQKFIARLPYLRTSIVTQYDAQLRGIDAVSMVYQHLSPSSQLAVAPGLVHVLPGLSHKKHWWDKKAFSTTGSRSANRYPHAAQSPRVIDNRHNYYASHSRFPNWTGGAVATGILAGSTLGFCLGVIAVAAGTGPAAVVVGATAATIAGTYVAAKIIATRANKQTNVGVTTFTPLLQNAYLYAAEHTTPASESDAFYAAMAEAMTEKLTPEFMSAVPKIASLKQTLTLQRAAHVRSDPTATAEQTDVPVEVPTEAPATPVEVPTEAPVVPVEVPTKARVDLPAKVQDDAPAAGPAPEKRD